MKKGFTLIELLAVIVILAIIALIATPIILGIINDARKESNERSAELYASAVRNAIASYQLTHPNAPASFSELDIEHDGNVVCATEELYEDGSFYIANCTVNGDEVEYTYGEPEVTQPTRYYSWSSGNIGDEITSIDAKRTVEELNSSYPFYLGLDVEAGKVSAAYVCFKTGENGTEYCLKGEPQEDKRAATYEANNAELLEAFGTNACSFDADPSSCSADGLDAVAHSCGSVGAYDGDAICYVNSFGFFECSG